MSFYTPPTLPLKVVMNKEKTKVLFAEANTDFINVLLSFLALPLEKLSSRFRPLGSLNTLQSGLQDMDATYFSVRGAKEMLLLPQISFRAEFHKLAVGVTYIPPKAYYVCEDTTCSKPGCTNVSIYRDIAKCDCGKWLNTNRVFGSYLDHSGLAFVTNPSSFIITDDLRVVPVVTGIIQTLANLGIKDIQGTEVRSLNLESKEMYELIKFGLTSATPLTDLINKLYKVSTTAAKPEPDHFNLHHHIPESKAHSREMVLKATLQKSTNKFLFAEATGEFVELLFSFLTIPLGGVESLFGGKDCLNSIDNLYRSVSNGFNDKFFATPDTKNRLINPKLPHGYSSKIQFLPLGEEAPPKLYYTASKNGAVTEFHEKNGSLVSSFKSSKETFVKKDIMCIVSDDLTVSPSLATSISILNDLGVPLSDVKETELRIGVKEALSILKASLTSKTSLTDALIKPMLNKLAKLERQPKQEP